MSDEELRWELLREKLRTEVRDQVRDHTRELVAPIASGLEDLSEAVKILSAEMAKAAEHAGRLDERFKERGMSFQKELDRIAQEVEKAIRRCQEDDLRLNVKIDDLVDDIEQHDKELADELKELRKSQEKGFWKWLVGLFR